MKPILIIVFALFSTVHAEVWSGTADVKFKGTSTLHDFEGSVQSVPLKVTVRETKNGRVVSATSDVEVGRMSTAHKDRDKNMWKMFKSSAFRFIKIVVPETPESTLRPAGGKPGTMPITMAIAGTTSHVTGTVTNVRESPAAIGFDLNFPVSLKAFNLKPPSTLVGLIKVGDVVHVTAQIALTPQKS
jgi:hypothetical protein